MLHTLMPPAFLSALQVHLVESFDFGLSHSPFVAISDIDG